MKKKVLLFVTAAGLVLSLSACAAKETSASVSVSSTQVTSTSVSNETPAVSAEKEIEAATEDVGPATEEIYFAVADVFTITLDEVKYTVVTGSPVGGTIYADDTLTLETDGEKIETKVVSFETMQGEHPASASENENIAVWLDKYLSETVVAGDKLVLVPAE